MKFLKEKKAFTLIELIISLAVSSILFFIIFTFIVDSLEELNNSNSKTILVNDILSFRNKLNRFIKWGYIDMSEVWTWEFDNLLLKDTYSTKWILYWVVDKNTMKLQKEYIYWENLLGYRLLSATEIINIEADNEEIYNMKFYLDKLYPWVKVKNFDIEFYNTWAILDLNLSILYSFNHEYFWESFTWIVIKSDEYVDFNLNF